MHSLSTNWLLAKQKAPAYNIHKVGRKEVQGVKYSIIDTCINVDFLVAIIVQYVLCTHRSNLNG